MTTNVRTRILPISLALAALVFWAAPALAQHGHGHRGHAGPGEEAGFHHLMRALDLTDAQREQVHEVALRYHDEILEPQRESLLAARQALAQAIHSTTSSEADVRESALALAALEADTAVQRHQLWVEIDAFLTDEQRQLVQEILAEGPPERPARRKSSGRR